MYSINIVRLYVLQVDYTLKYILERSRGNSSQKGESSSENCNKFEHKIVIFMLFSVLQKWYLVEGLYCNKNPVHQFSYWCPSDHFLCTENTKTGTLSEEIAF